MPGVFFILAWIQHVLLKSCVEILHCYHCQFGHTLISNAADRGDKSVLPCSKTTLPCNIPVAIMCDVRKKVFILFMFSFFLGELEKCLEDPEKLGSLFVKHVSTSVFFGKLYCCYWPT